MRSLVRFNPVQDVISMQHTMDRLLNEFTGGYANDQWSEVSQWKLALDVVETSEGYEVKASIPGVDADDIQITLNDNTLDIRAEIKQEEEHDEGNYQLRERRWGSFSRSLRFPVEVRSDGVEASYDAGVLALTVPKAEEVKPKRISVKKVVDVS